MIVACNERGCYRGDEELFCTMLDQGVLSDDFGFSTVLQFCVGQLAILYRQIDIEQP
ncbi:hypothetical protein Fmac_026298 [Flemingia macrophylla]|uniref:Pentatricopeptide repeat-containing protein n=1 Tax=Flemingia macrophylla TaxID=520843 RepID=A0ABD1LEG5_9FABA